MNPRAYSSLGTRRGAGLRGFVVVAGLSIISGATGCAAITNPVADGIPVRRLPPEIFGESKKLAQPVNLADLAPRPPDDYLLAPGDVLGIWVKGLFAGPNEPPPVRLPEQANLPPGIGYPTPVQKNGTITLPLLSEPLKVEGLTLDQVRGRMIDAYANKKDLLIQPQPIVTLLRPRTYHVLVLREDSGSSTFGSSGGFNGLGGGSGTFISETRRASGVPLDLPAYENNLLNALTRTGGLPGAEAEDEVIIERHTSPTGTPGRQTIRVPLRLLPGQSLGVRSGDLVLETGDVVLVRARKSELFFTGGLLPARAFPLPRDRDLDILEALALVGGPLFNGGINGNNLTGSLQQSGLGFPSPSLVTVIRKTSSGATIPILVSLNRAAQDARERILIQPGDFIVLQLTPTEAYGQYLTTNFRINLAWQFLRGQTLTGNATGTLP